MSRRNIPNLLTLLRIVLIPLIIFLHYLGTPIAAASSGAIFLLASFTDLLDGYYARKYKIVTEIGAILDLLADKLLVSCCLIWLSYQLHNIEIVISTILIISREIVISVLRQYALKLDNNNSLKVNYLGKTKTFVQMISIIILLLVDEYSNFFPLIKEVGIVLILFSCLLSLLSLAVYVTNFIKALPKGFKFFF